MKISYEDAVKGRTVIDASGRSVGVVDGLQLEQETPATGLTVGGMRVRLHNDVADEIGVSRGTFHPAIVDVPASALQAVGDAVILNVAITALVQPAAAPAEAP